MTAEPMSHACTETTMTDRYQPLRDAIAARSWPVGDSFQRNMQLVAALLRDYDRLREALHRISLGAQNSAHSKEALGREARAALAAGEES